MFRLLSRGILRPEHARCAPAALVRLHLQIAPAARPISSKSQCAADAPSSNGESQPSLTVSYLIRSCGLSPEAALSASKKVRLKAADGPDAVLEVLRGIGFSPTQISIIVSKFPRILLMRTADHLNPKLECLRRAGMSGNVLVDFLCRKPYFLLHSAENKIAPSLELLQQVLPAGVTVSDAIRLSDGFIPLGQSLTFEILRRRGVSDAGILKLLTGRVLVRVRSPDRLEEAVAAVQAMGVDPAKPIFASAVRVMAYLSRETWDRKLGVYRSVGWSDSEITAAFVKQPNLLTLSDEAIREKMKFFEGKLQIKPEKLSKNPVLLMLNLEKRIARRCAVLKVLDDRGVLKVKEMRTSWLVIPEEAFQRRFLLKYMAQVPEVIDAHQGKVEFTGFGTPAATATSRRKASPSLKKADQGKRRR